jgi:hypothetical protein
MTARERFVQAAQAEMLAFERREARFRKQERNERAAQLHLPIHAGDLPYRSPLPVRSRQTVAP